MLTPESIECIVASIIGTGSAFTGIGAVLKKAGLLHFGKNSKNGNKVIVPLAPCQAHDVIKSTLEEVKINQIINTQKHEQHTKDLEAGTRKFEKMYTEVSALREGIGILMDRSGGRPEKWRS